MRKFDEKSRIGKALKLHSLVIISMIFIIEAVNLATKIYYCNMEDNSTHFMPNVLVLLICSISFYFLLQKIRQTDSIRSELNMSREKYESVVSNVKEVIFQTDKKGNWTFLNPAWTEVTGFTIEESLGKNFLHFMHQDYREEFKDRFMNLNGLLSPYKNNIVKYMHKDGGYRWIEVQAKLSFNKCGNLEGTTGTLLDISRRKKIEHELERRDKLMLTITEAANMLLESSELQKSFNKALSMIGKAAEVDRVYVFRNKHEDNDRNKLMADVIYEWCAEGLVSQMGKYEAREIDYTEFEELGWLERFHNGDIVKAQIKNLPKKYRDFFGSMDVISIFNVPIFIEDKFWGLIGFDDCTRERHWSESEEAAMKLAAASLGSAIKRTIAEEALQQALQDDFRQTVRNLHNLVFKLKKNENNEVVFTLFEGKAAKIIDVRGRMQLNVPMEKIFRKDLGQYLIEHAQRAFQGETTNFESSLYRKTFFITLSPLTKNGRVDEVVGTAIDVTENKQAQEKIKYMAYYDTLTGLPNRVLFRERIGIEMSHANRSNTKTALMFLDLDRFKVINDTLGHIFGDRLLKEAAARLKSTLKEDDTVSRMGGDEFTILITDIRSEREVRKYAYAILEVFKDPFYINNKEIFITTSIGISMYPHDGTDVDTLIKNADAAMYRAKEIGRNNFQFYTVSMNERALEKLNLETGLRKAIERNEFYIAYQPKVDINTQKIVGSEALIRWNHGKLGIISPADFIPLAEETGLIVPIGEWILREACRQNKLWQSQGAPHLTVAVNISARQFLTQNIEETVAGILEETKLEPQYLELEITENIIMQNTELTLEALYKLKKMGVKISIDDFGTGFSSLSYLKKFNTDCLKVDQSFIRDLSTDQNSEAITTAIISMAHNLNLKVVAEGVETEEQLSFLKLHNCDEMQGYLFSRPLPKQDFEALLKEKLEL